MRGHLPEFKSGQFPPWEDQKEQCRKLTLALPEIILPHHHFRIVQIRPFRMPCGWTIPTHEHSYYEANIILSGKAMTFAPEPQELGPGHVFFHAPKMSHTWGAPTQDCSRLIVEFMIDPPLLVNVPPIWPCWPDLLGDISQLYNLAQKPKPGWIDQAAARLATILARILTLGELPEPETATGKTTDQLMAAVDTFLTDNLHREVSLHSVATVAAVSLSALTHRYRKLSGISVGQRLLSLRMEKAAQLLKTTTLPLKEISKQVGITETAYFCRMFKRYFSDTPTQFRDRSTVP